MAIGEAPRVAVGVEFLKPVPRIEIHLKTVVSDQVNPSGGASCKQVFSVIEIKGNQIELALVFVVGGKVRTLARTESTTQCRRTWRRIAERDFSDFLCGRLARSGE